MRSMNTSNLSVPRIVRRHRPSTRITCGNYRKTALGSLLLDFEHRCAYSMIHALDAGGYKEMEIDHFDPRRKADPVQDYVNLYYSSGHCNRSKGPTWPSAAEERLGIRFLDCCREADYGGVLFEDPNTHEIVGTTPAAKFHVVVLDLNAPHLVQRRRERAEIHRRLEEPVVLRSRYNMPERNQIQRLHDVLNEMLVHAIPPIPPPPIVTCTKTARQ